MPVVEPSDLFPEYIVFCTDYNMAEEHYAEDLVIAVMRESKHDLAENLCYKNIIEELYSMSVINVRQYDLINKCEKNKGEICAIDKVLDMVINKKVQVSGFMKVLKKKIPWEHSNIEEGVKKFQSGERITPGLTRK